MYRFLIVIFVIFLRHCFFFPYKYCFGSKNRAHYTCQLWLFCKWPLKCCPEMDRNLHGTFSWGISFRTPHYKCKTIHLSSYEYENSFCFFSSNKLLWVNVNTAPDEYRITELRVKNALLLLPRVYVQGLRWSENSHADIWVELFFLLKLYYITQRTDIPIKEIFLFKMFCAF